MLDFAQFELDLVNQELQELADEAVQAAVDLEYDAMIESWMEEMLMLDYATRSYDNDAIAYAEMF